MLKIGEEIELGWNGAKLFAGRGVLAWQVVRIEAVGKDWVVVRDEEGQAYAYGFSKGELRGGMRKVLGS